MKADVLLELCSPAVYRAPARLADESHAHPVVLPLRASPQRSSPLDSPSHRRVSRSVQIRVSRCGPALREELFVRTPALACARSTFAPAPAPCPSVVEVHSLTPHCHLIRPTHRSRQRQLFSIHP